MKCSVVMSTYNGEKFILEQLESIQYQSRRPDEVIIFDDCSTDNTYFLIQDYIRRNQLQTWILYARNENIGFIKSFTDALKYATGDVIFLADQDDIWDKRKVASFMKIMKKYPQILALNSSFLLINDKSEMLEGRTPPFTANNGWIMLQCIKDKKIAQINQRKVLASNISPGCTLAIKNTLIDDFLDFEDGEMIPHDWKLNYLAARRQGCYFWNCPMTHYRLHSNNTIGMDNDNILSAEYKIKSYQEHIVGYNAFIKAFLAEGEEKNIEEIGLCKKRIKYYSDRIKALQERSYLKTIQNTLYGTMMIGPEGMVTLMDLLSFRKNN